MGFTSPYHKTGFYMRKLKIKEGLVAIVDDEDYEKVSSRSWYYNGRYVVTCDSKVLFLHRIINNTPDGMVTDHINGDTLDNRKSNLRTCTQSQNRMNSKKQIARKWTPTSLYKGVRKRNDTNPGTKCWTASIKHVHLGSFYTEVEAAQAYNQKAKELFGEYARLNIIN